MARPLKDGLDYFSLDTNFFQDKKVQLIKSEFGIKGVGILIALLCDIYGENGYFKNWDSDDCFLMAEALAGGCTPNKISEVVHGCLRRSMFNGRVFEAFGVLTSAGIQRRYIRAMSKREEIPVIKEYWLLDLDDKKDVPASMRDKVAFKSVSVPGNPDKAGRNPGKAPGNPQSKVNESKDIGDGDLQDSELARARETAVETVETGGKPCGNVESQIISLDSYTGMTPELKAQAMTMADQLIRHYFGRTATEHDATKLYERIRDLHPGPAKIDSERAGLVARVFQTAAEDGVFKWKYIDGILLRCARREIHTADDFERYEAQRDFDKDNRR